MAAGTIGCLRFFDFHYLVTRYTLPVIRPFETRPFILTCLEGFSVTGGAPGRLRRGRTIVVASHAHGRLLFMKKTGHPVVFHSCVQFTDNPAMRKSNGLILIRHGFYGNIFRNLFIRRQGGLCRRDVQCFPGKSCFLLRAHRQRFDAGFVNSMTLITGHFGELLFRH